MYFFDCTNYYFEIDIPRNDKQKGPSKENRLSSIIGQALLLDADLVPYLYANVPGKIKSEKPYIRKVIEEMKQRHKCIRQNYSIYQETNPLMKKSKKRLDFSNLDALYLTQAEIDKFLSKLYALGAPRD